jgi:high-affinity iron transporter
VLGNALIGLREGLEAGLVVSILVAFLVRTDRRSELPKVWLGVGIAIAVSVGVTLALALAQQQLTFEAQETFGGSLSIIAVGFVTWMIFWMRKASRTIARELRDRMDVALRMGPAAVVLLDAPGGPLDLGRAARQARGRARHGPGCRGRDGHARRRP